MRNTRNNLIILGQVFLIREDRTATCGGAGLGPIFFKGGQAMKKEIELVQLEKDGNGDLDVEIILYQGVQPLRVLSSLLFDRPSNLADKDFVILEAILHEKIVDFEIQLQKLINEKYQGGRDEES